METEYSKRVYQGVRVKHTVKDLLAERRSRQTRVPRFTGVSASQSPFVQMSGSPVLQGYYSVRRTFISEGEFCPSSKQLSTDIYPSSSLTGKPVPCEPVPMSGYQSLLDGYYADSFSDYRSATLSGGGSTIFSSSALPTLLPPLHGDTSNFVLRDSWEPAVMEAVEGMCADSQVSASVPASLAVLDPSSPGLPRCSGRGSAVPSPQFYPLHPLDDLHCSSPIQPVPNSFACPAYMAVSGESMSKTPALSSAEMEIMPPLMSDALPWVKEDVGSGPWSQYEIRRSF